MIIVVAAMSMTMAMTIVIVNGRYPLIVLFSSEHMPPSTSLSCTHDPKHMPPCTHAPNTDIHPNAAR